MRIVFVNDSDRSGGAAIASYRIMKAVEMLKNKVYMMVRQKDGNDPAVLPAASLFYKLFSIIAPYSEFICKFFYKAQVKGLHSVAIVSSLDKKQLIGLKPDIVHLNWICNGFLVPEDLLKIDSPIVWTMHDVWPFSGSEHYFGLSDRYVKGYLKNNRNGDDRGIDVDRITWMRKLKVLQKKNNIYFVAPSKWLGKCANKSLLLKSRKVSVIPNCVDTSTFKPLRISSFEKKFHLDRDKYKYILFGAMGAVSDPRKGYAFFKESLKHIKFKGDLKILIFGSSDFSESFIENIPVVNVGRLNTAEDLAALYNVADLFIAPSIEDNLPNTIMESMSCGTPCVAFDVGGISDMIDHGVNGYLARPQNAVDLAAGIDWLLMDSNRHRAAVESRKKVLGNFSYKIVGEKYNNLYKEIVGEN